MVRRTQHGGPVRRARRIVASSAMMGVALALPVAQHPDTVLQFLAACLRGGLAVWAGMIAGPAIGELWREARDRWAMHMRWRRTRRNGRRAARRQFRKGDVL